MGSIIGGIIGGIGSLFGGNSQSKADKQAAQQALTGYNYLTSGAGAAPTSSYINNGAGANNMIAQMLGAAPMTPGTQGAFNNYRDSSGYNFLMDQGQHAITGSAAARGILNSGATAKALTQFGQGLADTTYNNYLNNLGTLANRGQTSLGQVANAGSAGGGAAAQATSAAGKAQSQGINGMMGGFSNALVGALDFL